MSIRIWGAKTMVAREMETQRDQRRNGPGLQAAGLLIAGLMVSGCGGIQEKPAPVVGSTTHAWSVFAACWKTAGEGHTRERRGPQHSLRYYYGLHRDAVREQCRAYADRPNARLWEKINKKYPGISASKAFEKSCGDALKVAHRYQYDLTHFRDHLALCRMMAEELEN
jgi:hypothetical protein